MCRLLSFRFAPRIRDLKEKRLYLLGVPGANTGKCTVRQSSISAERTFPFEISYFSLLFAATQTGKHVRF